MKKMSGDRLSRRVSYLGFLKVFYSINQHGIQKGFDRMGIVCFIEHCARLAASTGAVTGMGGAMTMIVVSPPTFLPQSCPTVPCHSGHYLCPARKLYGQFRRAHGGSAFPTGPRSGSDADARDFRKGGRKNDDPHKPKAGGGSSPLSVQSSAEQPTTSSAKSVGASVKRIPL